jgi:hypothetical protein
MLALHICHAAAKEFNDQLRADAESAPYPSITITQKLLQL